MPACDAYACPQQVGRCDMCGADSPAGGGYLASLLRDEQQADAVLGDVQIGTRHPRHDPRCVCRGTGWIRSERRCSQPQARPPDRRSSTASQALAAFHAALGDEPGRGGTHLRMTLHNEEHAELIEALAEYDLAHIARELADVVYVAYGTAHAFAIDLDAALEEVHRANMSKANGPRRGDGKLLKPPGFRPPDMGRAVPS
jgi:NTP pyrophosphatase (non-canonical NTP hydrolase)